MATSSSSSWVRGFSGNPAGEACAGRSLAELLAEIGDERLVYPIDDLEAPAMTRRELLCRVLWTRGVVDGDRTAIRVFLEDLEGKPGRELTGLMGNLGDLTAQNAWWLFRVVRTRQTRQYAMLELSHSSRQSYVYAQKAEEYIDARSVKSITSNG